MIFLYPFVLLLSLFSIVSHSLLARHGKTSLFLLKSIKKVKSIELFQSEKIRQLGGYEKLLTRITPSLKQSRFVSVPHASLVICRGKVTDEQFLYAVKHIIHR